MKVKKSEINILIMLIGILLAVLSYFVVYSSFSEKKDVLAAENATLQIEVDELQKLADNKQHYIDETNRMDGEIQDILSGFPGEIRAEDQVMYTASLESMFTVWVNGLSIEDTQLVQVAAPEPQPEAPTDDAVVEDTGEGANDAVVATGGLKDTVFLYSSPFTLNYKTTYRSFKDIVQLIVDADDRMSIKNISISYDGETGCLAGSLDATMYTVSGTDFIYQELDVPGVRMGTADFFKSGTVLDLNRRVQSDTGEEEDTEGEEGEEETSDEEVTGN